MVAKTRERSGFRIRRQSIEDGIRLYERYTRRFERCHGRSSAEMEAALASGEADCTPEIALWMTSYRQLQDLRVRISRTTG